MTSKLIVNSVRHTGASSDAITMDASGNVTFPGNATCSGTASGFGKIVQVKSVSKLDSFTVASPTAHQYYDVTGLDNLQITTTGSNKVIVHMTVHMGIDRDGYNGFFKGVRITSGVYYNLSFPSSTGSSNRASNAGEWTDSTSVPDNRTHAMHIVGFEDSPGAGTHQYGIQIGSSYTRALYTGRPYGGEATGHVYAPSGTITLYEVEA
tara:strand:+ start:1541 stop:2164 length:624 start_codon:yes stop_codon:yes gene_type:complete